MAERVTRYKDAHAAVRGARRRRRDPLDAQQARRPARRAAISSSTTRRRSPSSTSTRAVSSARGRGRRRPRLEETVTKNNVEAAKEVVRQLRLRDIGGIIVIDFVDMANPKNRATVEEALKRELERDRTKTYVVEISPLGLVEMTRQNVTEGPREILTRRCPTCEGDGTILSEASTVVDTERRLRALASESPRTKAFRVELNARVRDLLVGPGAAQLAGDRGRDEAAVLPRVEGRCAARPLQRPRQGAAREAAAAGGGRRGRRSSSSSSSRSGSTTSKPGSASSTAWTSPSRAQPSSSARRCEIRVERVLDGTAFATLAGTGKRPLPTPITAEGLAEKPTRASRSRKAPRRRAEVEGRRGEAVAEETDGDRATRRRSRRGGRPRRRRRRSARAAARAAGATARRSPPLRLQAANGGRRRRRRRAPTPKIHLPAADLGAPADA